MKRVPLTPEIVESIKAALKRKGKTMRALLKDCTDLPEGFTYRTVTSWTSRAQKTTRADHLNYVLRLLDIKPPTSAVGTERAHLDSKTIAELNAHKERTGLTPATLLRGAVGRPKDLHSQAIAKWLRGQMKTARADHLSYVLQLWQS